MLVYLIYIRLIYSDSLSKSQRRYSTLHNVDVVYPIMWHLWYKTFDSSIIPALQYVYNPLVVVRMQNSSDTGPSVVNKSTDILIF